MFINKGLLGKNQIDCGQEKMKKGKTAEYCFQFLKNAPSIGTVNSLNRADEDRLVRVRVVLQIYQAICIGVSPHGLWNE